MYAASNQQTIQVPEKLEPLFYSKGKYRYVCIDGGRGSAKSWSVADYFILTSTIEKSRYLCTREIQNTIRDSVHKLLSDKIFGYGWSDYFDIKNDSIITLNTGSEFIFKGLLRNPQDIKSMEGIDYCWVEEAHSVSRQSLDTLIPTVRNPNSQIIFTYNPTNETDPVHVDFKLSDRQNVLRITANYYDNPWFPEVLREEMEYDRAHDIDKYLHIWEGQPLKHSKAQIFFGKWVVDSFDIPDKTFFYFGVDWGFSGDPVVMVKTFIKEKYFYICDEVWGLNVELDDLPGKFKTIPLSDKYPARADNSRPETISYVKRHGFPLLEKASQGKGSIEDGIEFLKSFEKIIIHPKCVHTIDEFKLYSYIVDKKTGEVSREVEDKNNHCIDAIRYSVEKFYTKFQFDSVGPNGAR